MVHLINFLEGIFSKYEWSKYLIIQNLSLTQSFQEKELRQLYFQKLKIEESNLVKISLYRLLYKHCKTNQLIKATRVACSFDYILKIKQKRNKNG